MKLPGRRRALLIATWITLWGIVGLVALEATAYFLLVDWTGVGKRPIHPYLVNGGFYEYLPDEVMMAREGPGAYGYRREGGLYVYTFDRPVADIADRGEFLFQDRRALANDTGSNGALRVFVIGGSAAYGIGASSHETRWYILLERSLTAALGREVRLIPAAMSGYVSTQELLVLELMALPRCPDAVVLFDGYNDLALPAIFGSRPGDPYNQGVLYEHFYSASFGIKRTLAQHSHLFRYLMKWRFRKALEGNRQTILRDPARLVNYAESTTSVYLDNVSRMVARCRDAGVPCGVFIQPARALTWRNQGIRRTLRSEDVLTLAAYDELLKRVRALGRSQAVHDLTPVFDKAGSAEWYDDIVHFTDPGHRAVAEAMHPIVLEMLRRSATKPGRAACAGRGAANGRT